MLSDKLPFRPDHTQVEVVAKYRRDFVDGTSNQPRTSGRWHYFTNSWTPIGEAEGYSELLWDTKRRVYDPNGDRATSQESTCTRPISLTGVGTPAREEIRRKTIWIITSLRPTTCPGRRLSDRVGLAGSP